ncbi:MAG: site-specific integrase [Agriterribacter sp.]
MRFPVKVICRTNRVHSDGTSSVFIRYCFNQKQKPILFTGIKIPAQYWNQKKATISNLLPPATGDYEKMNSEIFRLKRLVEDMILHASQNNVTDIATYVKQHYSISLDSASYELVVKTQKIETLKKEKAKEDIYYQFDDYIRCKCRKVSKATLTVYNNVKAHLKAFEKYRKVPITFSSLDFSFYEDFVDYLTFEHVHLRRKEIFTGIRLNTIGKTIKHLRGFIKDRIKRKIIAPIDLSDYKIPEEDSDAIYLTHEEIVRIYNVDLTKHPHLIEYRDLFVLACLTGLRFSDFSSLKPEDLQKDMLHKKQEKSDHWVIIPLRKEAKYIFTRQFKDRIPELTNPEFNRHIKTIGRLAGIVNLITFSFKKGNQTIQIRKPKFEWITSHTARRSFCTNEFLAGTPVELIMKISGHKRTKDFYKYVRISPEEAALKIKALWMERNEMELIKS